MAYNILNYPGSDSAIRNPYLHTTISAIDPDIMTTEENNGGNGGVAGFLQNVLNVNGQVYSAGTFIDGYDSDNALYYKTSKFTFVSNVVIYTALRNINEFTVVYNASGDTLRIYCVHLKASNGAAEEAQRAVEVDHLRARTNALPPGTNFIVAGDCNFYRAGDSAYIKLLQDNVSDDGNVIDPIPGMTGNWNTAAYAHYHTQSPRTRAFGGGITGGLDDRFDLILYSTAIGQPGGVDYVPGSMTAYGNDGNHYNDSINDPPNTAVSQAIADAIHYGADHLPVYADFIFQNASNGINNTNLFENGTIFYPNPSTGVMNLRFTLKSVSDVEIRVLDLAGKLVKTISHRDISPGTHEEEIVRTDELEAGIYFCNIRCGSKSLFAKLIITQTY